MTASSPTAAFDELAPRLRRWPDVETHDLVAADASDRLLLASAELSRNARVAVIGDRHGALALSLAASGHRVRTHQDGLAGERAARLNAVEAGLAEPAAPDEIEASGISWHGLDATLVEGARTVLLQLPRSLEALDEIASVAAAHAHPEAQIVAVGRVKHMTLAMNEVLARYFESVTADRGVGKSRVLRAAGPRQGADPGAWPRRRHHADLGLTVCAHGAAFAGTSIDIGTRLLLETMPRMPHAENAVDLGCGTGVIAACYALQRESARVLASDQSAAAIRSAQATARANGVADRVTAVRDDALSGQPDASADLVLLNPPFHSGAAVTDVIAPRLFADAARVLRLGGELWTVWNSHLRYRPALERIVGPTRQIARNAKFTVTASARRA